MSENTADCCRASPSAAAAASAATVSSSGGDGKAPKLPDRVKRNGILISLRVASARRMSCGGCGPALRCVPAELQRAMDWDVQSMAVGSALTELTSPTVLDVAGAVVVRFLLEKLASLDSWAEEAEETEESEETEEAEVHTLPPPTQV